MFPAQECHKMPYVDFLSFLQGHSLQLLPWNDFIVIPSSCSNQTVCFLLNFNVCIWDGSPLLPIDCFVNEVWNFALKKAFFCLIVRLVLLDLNWLARHCWHIIVESGLRWGVGF